MVGIDLKEALIRSGSMPQAHALSWPSLIYCSVLPINHHIWYNDTMNITANAARIRYRSDSGWAVIDFVDDTNMRFVGVGIMPTAYEGEKLRLEGEWTVHPTYGKQFSIASAESAAPDSGEAVLRYLSSGLIKGVGLSTAKAIVDKFGEETLDVIEHFPSRLEQVSGIGKVRSRMIHESFMERRGIQDIFIGLQGMGFTVNQAAKIYKLYGEGCVQMIKEDPYRLIRDVDQIGFKTADRIARNNGVEFDSPFRIRAGVRYTLQEARNDGNTCLPKDLLVQKAAAEVLGVDILPVERQIEELIVSGDLVEKELGNEELVFLSYLYHQEMDSASRLMMLAQSAEILPMFDVEGEIGRLERKLGILLDAKQKKAVESAFKEGVVVITGGPGTGKTTILKFIIELMGSIDKSIELAAPTGRAAKRMTDATGVEARTIHRLLEYGGFGEEGFAKNEDDPIEADVIIIDEMSMVDVSLFHSLLKAVAEGTRLIMVGDFDQLPPVGPGNVLKDIILSETLPVIRLTDIYRQAGRSMIVINAHRINHGQKPVVDQRENDFVFISRPRIEDALNEVISVCTRYAAGDADADFQVLAPMKANLLGVNNLNAVLQEAVNPPSPEKEERRVGDVTFRVGDRVMQVKNNYKLEWKRRRYGREEETGTGVFNGDIGTVMEIDRFRQTVSILFDDERLAKYAANELEEIEQAYAISVHKSQGSEFGTVILPLVFGPPMLMNRNVLYTAVTRARNRVIMIGSAKCVEGMVENVSGMKRYSALKSFLELLAEDPV